MTTVPTTWVPDAAGSHWDVDNLPYGVYSVSDSAPRTGVRIGDFVLDLGAAAAADSAPFAQVLQASTLNPLLAEGPETWSQVRAWIVGVLTNTARQADLERLLTPVADVTMHLAIAVGDYVDFYASIDHATNVGTIFRPDGDALLPNWRHLPVGYHGRSGTVVVSGTDIRRPQGQRKAPDAAEPTFGPSIRLDIEAELGFVVGAPSQMGTAVPTSAFDQHVFGVVGLNDWSARDVQAWEYVPLGPFLGKSFATSISAWVTPLAALEAARIDLPEQTPEVLPYLQVGPLAGYDINLEVEVNGVVVARPPYRSMYWSPAQMLAHMTVNGASVRTGDLYGSGTISGPERDERGSFLELSWGGKEPWTLNGAPRTFLEDGDEIVLRLTAPGQRGPIALGEVRGTILPAA